MASSSIPTTMHGIYVAKTGGPEVFEFKSLPVPSVREGEILVRNAFAGVNYIDTHERAGIYRVSLPFTAGREGAGTVVQSKSPNFAPGDRVVWMKAYSGTYAEYSAVPAADAVAIPDGLDTKLAAAAFIQGLSAWTFIREAGQVREGMWTLVHAAAGGTGSLLVQMLRNVGAKVIGTAGGPEKRELAKRFGAQWVLDSRTEDDIVARVAEITGGHGVDVIFDGVGKATFDKDLEMAAVKGSIVCFGSASGGIEPFNLLRLTAKNLKITRPMVGNYLLERKELERYAGELFDMIIKKKVNIEIFKVYPLKEAAQSHIDLTGRGTTGKLLIECN